MKYLVYIFYNHDREIEAHTLDVKLANTFRATRSKTYYIFKSLKMNEYQYRSFLSMYNKQMIFMNVLTDGVESFNFPTTYLEELDLTKECERVYDELLLIEKEIRSFPLSDIILEHFERVASYLHKDYGRFGFFNTFNIFITTWGDKML